MPAVSSEQVQAVLQELPEQQEQEVQQERGTRALEARQALVKLRQQELQQGHAQGTREHETHRRRS